MLYTNVLPLVILALLPASPRVPLLLELRQSRSSDLVDLAGVLGEELQALTSSSSGSAMVEYGVLDRVPQRSRGEREIECVSDPTDCCCLRHQDVILWISP